MNQPIGAALPEPMPLVDEDGRHGTAFGWTLIFDPEPFLHWVVVWDDGTSGTKHHSKVDFAA